MTVPRSIQVRSIFVDTSAFVAHLNASDRDHRRARLAFLELGRERRPLYTSNLVVAETYAVAMRALGRSTAIDWLGSIGEINLLFADELDHVKICALLERYTDKRFSYADAYSFILMERLDIPVAFTFDRDFRQYGLVVMP